MKYRVCFSPESQNDMEKIWDDVWEASKDFDIADKYIDDLTDEILKFQKNPKTGIPLYYYGLFSGFYSVNFKAYKAFYRINGNSIEVVRILLAKTDFIKTLFGDYQEN